jgi:hypothetical protein
MEQFGKPKSTIPILLMEPVPERSDPAIRKSTVPGHDTTQGDQRAIKRVGPKIGHDQADRRGSRSGRAYVPLQTTASGTSDQSQNGHPVRKDWRKSALIYLLVVMAAAVIAGGGYYAWQHSGGGTSTSQVLMLSDSDIDQQLTQRARDSLQRGEVPPYLRNTSQQALEKIKNGEMDLARKVLFDPTKASGIMVHVYVSINGQLALTDVLTEEHPSGTIVPVSRKSVTHFHFVVDSAGSQGTVTCFVPSNDGIVLHTPPLPTGGQADLEMQRR